MSVFRPEDRWDKDPRILKIKDRAEVSLYQKRDELGFKGILLPYQVSDKVVEGAKSAFPIGKDFLEVQYDAQDFQLKKYFKMAAAGFPRQVWNTAIDLEQIFHKAAPDEKIDMLLKYNSEYPADFEAEYHLHSTAMTFTLLGKPTIILNEDDEFHPIPDGHILLLDHLPHCAPELKNPEKRHEELERITFVL